MNKGGTEPDKFSSAPNILMMNESFFRQTNCKKCNSAVVGTTLEMSSCDGRHKDGTGVLFQTASIACDRLPFSNCR